MKKLIPAAFLLAASCAAPGRRAPSAPAAPASVSAQPSHPLFPETPEVKNPNFILVVSEAVPDPSYDGISYTKVFIGDSEVGRTDVGRKSEDRVLKLKLPVGNQPIRLEQWDLPGVGDWTRLDDDFQPRERFVRIEPGSVVRLELHFSEGEASNTLALTREPAPK